MPGQEVNTTSHRASSSEDRQVRGAACVRAFREEFDFVHRCVRRHGARPAEMDDLIQEVFIAMWRRWSDFDDSRPLRPWLAGIAFRVVRCHVRRRGPDPVAVDPDGVRAGNEDAGASRDDSQEARALVLSAIERLPERHRAPLVMHDLDELSVNEMARLLELPLATVYTRVRRARLAFAKAVADLQKAQPAKVRALMLTPGSLLALERRPPGAPPLARERATKFAEEVVKMPGAPPDPLAAEAARPRLPGARWPVSPLVALAGAAALGAAVLVLFAWRTPRPDSAPVAAKAAARPVVTNTGRPATGRKSIPSFQIAAAAGPATYSAEVARELGVGLTGYWPLDDGPGATLARDHSGAKRHCRFRNVRRESFIDGVSGGALALDAHTWLHCPQPPVLRASPTALTVAAWVKRRSPRAPAAIVTRQIGRSYEDHFFLGFNADSLRVVSHVWNGVASVNAPPPSDRWHHTTFTHGDGTTRLYLDGVEVANSTGLLRGGSDVIDSSITIGAGRFSRYVWTVRQKLDGAVDEVVMYDRVLSPLEVRALAAGVRPIPAPVPNMSNR